MRSRFREILFAIERDVQRRDKGTISKAISVQKNNSFIKSVEKDLSSSQSLE